jgi:THO complex subunit 2
LGEFLSVSCQNPSLNHISAGFYVSFWQLSTYDLAPPTSRYNEETKNLANLSRQEDSKAYSAERSADRATRAKASLHRARREQCNAAQTTLNQEFKEQTEMRSFTLRRITREKMHWFAHGSYLRIYIALFSSHLIIVPKPGSLASAFVEYCIQPRCLLSPMDADFCAQMIKMLQTQGTPGFSTLLCYDKVRSLKSLYNNRSTSAATWSSYWSHNLLV